MSLTFTDDSQPPTTFDTTPTWEAVMSIVLQSMRNTLIGSSSGPRMSLESLDIYADELIRLALFVDRRNASEKAEAAS